MLKLILTGFAIGTATIAVFGVGMAVVMGPFWLALSVGSFAGGVAGFAWMLISMIALSYVLAVKYPLGTWMSPPPPPPWRPD